MFKTLFNAFKVKDIRKKLLIVLGLILVYRVGCAIVCPGFNCDRRNNLLFTYEYAVW